jgi:hypothetical protein
MILKGDVRSQEHGGGKSSQVLTIDLPSSLECTEPLVKSAYVKEGKIIVYLKDTFVLDDETVLSDDIEIITSRMDELVGKGMDKDSSMRDEGPEMLEKFITFSDSLYDILTGASTSGAKKSPKSRHLQRRGRMF